MAILRRHRAAGRSLVSPLVLPSFLCAIAPWVWSSTTGLMAVLAVHAVWLVACELMSPKKTVDRAKHQTSPQPPSAPPTFVATTVLAVLDETDDVRTFRMARPAGMPFSAGQFLAVKALIDGKPHVRCYSISSAPHVLGYLEISVRRQGLVSGTLHATIRAGSTLSINRPAGQFVYPQDDDRPLVLIAGGIGITPLLSMLRHATATDPVRPITLLYSARTENDVAFRRELALIAERHPQVRIAITLTRATADTRLRTGRIDADLMRQYVSAPSHTIFCLCGPAPMLDEVRAVLLALGVGPDQIRHEQFELAVAASQLQSAPPAERTQAGTVTVRFANSGRSVSAPASRTLLETAEAEGIAIASSCRSGVCQSCRTRLSAGHADCRSDVLDPADRAAGFILPCVTWPADDCVLEA